MDAVYLWCPAYTLPPERLEPARSAGVDFARAIGMSLTEAPDLAAETGPGAWRLAVQRQPAFVAGLTHRVLLAARGGYGCLDLLETVRNHRGPLPYLIGYSDLTVLHAAWRVLAAGESLYGFMPGVPHGERAVRSAIQGWRGEHQKWTATHCPQVVPAGTGTATGPLFAGCLRVLAGLVGTPWMPSLRGCILAIEDIDERPYRIDRDLTQLHLAGCLAGVVGLVTNSFPCQLPDGYAGPTATDIIAAWAGRLGVPAITGLPFGHHADPIALPCGRATSLAVTTTGWELSLSAR